MRARLFFFRELRVPRNHIQRARKDGNRHLFGLNPARHFYVVSHPVCSLAPDEVPPSCKFQILSVSFCLSIPT